MDHSAFGGKRPSASSADTSSDAKTAGQLVIVALRAEGVAAVDKSGTSDPYAKIFVDGPGVKEERKTKERKKTLDPVWGERFDIVNIKDPSTTSVRVELKDYNAPSLSNALGTSKPLGEFDFALSDLELPTTGELIEKSFELQQPSSSQKAATVTATGTIFLKIGYLPLAAPPATEDAYKASQSSSTGAKEAKIAHLEAGGKSFAPAAHGGQLKIVVASATGLRTADKIGLSDPYAKLVARCNGNVLKATPSKTRTIEKTLDPAWYEEFVVGNVDDPVTARVAIVVKDEDKGFTETNHPLGQADINIHTLMASSAGLTGDGAWLMLDPLELTNVTESSGVSLVGAHNRANAPTATGSIQLYVSYVEPPQSVVDRNVSKSSKHDIKFDGPTKSCQLCVAIKRAYNLAAADKRGTSDPYVKLIVKTGEKQLDKRTKTIKKTLDPVWNEVLTVEGVTDDEAQDGSWVSRETPLLKVLEPGVKQVKKEQGTIELMVAWSAPSEEELAKLIEKKKEATGASKELEEYAIPEGEDGDLAAKDPAEEGPSVDDRIEKELQKGDYQLQAHIIEAKDLKGRDATGLSDPFVCITCFGHSDRTATINQTSSAVWDEQLFFEGKEQHPDQLNSAVVTVQVFDADAFSKTLIGEYTTDLMNIYYEPHHEIYRRWVALTAPASVRSKGDSGVQGYVKLTLVLLGPGDKPRVHKPDEEEEADAILLPPALRLELAFLVVKIHKAEGLPQMDRTMFGKEIKNGAGIDAYTKLLFNGYKANTKVIKSRQPSWQQEFWIPVLLPTVGQFLTVKVRDHDVGLDPDDDVDVLTIPFDKIRKRQVPETGWWHLYGLAPHAEKVANTSLASTVATSAVKAVSGAAKGLLTGNVEGAASAMTEDGVLVRRRELQKHAAYYASTWRGRLLMSVSVHTPDEKKMLPEKLLKKVVKEPPKRPEVEKCELRAAVLLGSGCDHALGFEGADATVPKVLVEVVVEDFLFETRQVDVRDGVAYFMPEEATVANPPGVLKKVGDLKEFALPKDPRQIADVIVYLTKIQSKGGAEERVRIAFHRFTAAELMDHGYGFTRKWLTLKPIMATGKPKKGQPLPSILMQALLIGPTPEEIAPTEPRSTVAAVGDDLKQVARVAFQIAMLAVQATKWPPAADTPGALPTRNFLTAYELRVHLFAARDLPASDDNGALDAYMYVKINGESAETSVQHDTTHPQWYETLVIRTWLPSDREIAPQLVCSVWDKDFPDPDDLVGVCRLSVDRGHYDLAANKELPDPVWVPLTSRGTQGEAKGEVLVALEVLPLPISSITAPDGQRDPRVKGKPFEIATMRDSGTVTNATSPKLLPHPRPLRELYPEAKKAMIGVAVLGVNELRPAGLLDKKVSVIGLKKPFVQVDIGRRGKATGKSGNFAYVRKTSTSSKPSPNNPLYLELLELAPFLPKKRVLLPPLNVAVRDSLFGGFRTPLIGSTVVRLEQKLPESFYATDVCDAGQKDSRRRIAIVVWENQRYAPWAMKWNRTDDKIGTDPPCFSNERPPFVPEKDPEKHELPVGWEWEGEWRSEVTQSATDAEGWLYATSFTTGKSEGQETLNSFGEEGHWLWTYVRRRKWVRVQKEKDCPNEKMLEMVSAAKVAKREARKKSRALSALTKQVNFAASPVGIKRSSRSYAQNYGPATEEDAKRLYEGEVWKLMDPEDPANFQKRYMVLWSDGRLERWRTEADVKKMEPKGTLDVAGATAKVTSGVGMHGRVRISVEPADGTKPYPLEVESGVDAADTWVKWLLKAAQGGAPAAQAGTPGDGVELTTITTEIPGDSGRSLKKTTVKDDAKTPLLQSAQSRRTSSADERTSNSEAAYSKADDVQPVEGDIEMGGIKPLADVTDPLATAKDELSGERDSQATGDRDLVASSDAGSDAGVSHENVMDAIEAIEAKLYDARNQKLRLETDLKRKETPRADKEKIKERLNNYIETVNDLTDNLAQLREQADMPDDNDAPGLKWCKVGETEPSHGTEFTNERLATALAQKLEFTKEELHSFGVERVRVDHFVKSGTSYYQPADHEEISIMPRYMKGRHTNTEELEKSLSDIPFERFELMSGQGRHRTKVGTLKALVRVGEEGPANAPWTAHETKLLEDLKQPREYFVRVYVLTGHDLKRLDEGSGSDPYLRIKLGNQVQDNRADHLNDVGPLCHFYHVFELNTKLPGASLLTLECYDYDSFGRASDDLIGRTEIDLDDRLFSPSWKKLADKPPLERRDLYTPYSKHSQGYLMVWVDILEPHVAVERPILDIKPPPAQHYQLRVICYSCKDVPDSGLDGSGLADLYTRIKFGESSEWESTDTHLRAQDGKASWNWRFKLDVTMDSLIKSEFLRLKVQLWDRDLISANDVIGEATIDLSKWLKRLYMRRAMGKSDAGHHPLYWSVDEMRDQIHKGGYDAAKGDKQFAPMHASDASDEDKGGVSGKLAAVLTDVIKPIIEQIIEQQPLISEDDPELEASKFYLPMRTTDNKYKLKHQGKVLLSIQLVPLDKVERYPCGFGRDEPNVNPKLPAPVGRLEFSLNPFKMLYRLIGPKYFNQLAGTCCCIFCVILCILLAYYTVPVIFGNRLSSRDGFG